jgi:hypothetical protein
MSSAFQPNQEPVPAKESPSGWPALSEFHKTASSGPATGTHRAQESGGRSDCSASESAFFRRIRVGEPVSKLVIGRPDLVGYPSDKWLPRLESA